MDAVYADSAQYLSIGDTILISYKQKVYQVDIEEDNLNAANANFISNEAQVISV